MKADRRDFIKAVSVLAATGTVEHSVSAQGAASVEVAGQPPGRLGDIEAFAFDAYGTLFDVFSVTALCEELFPGHGDGLARLWRTKQLQYSLLRSLMGRHKDFWLVTEDALVYASKSLRLDLTQAKRGRLMQAYLTLAAFPDVRPGLEALKRQGVRLAILSNGEPRMLEAAATSAGIDTLLDTIISVEEIKIFKVSPRGSSLGLERLQAEGVHARADLEDLDLLDADDRVEQRVDAGALRRRLEHTRLAVRQDGQPHALALQCLEARPHVRKRSQREIRLHQPLARRLDEIQPQALRRIDEGLLGHPPEILVAAHQAS